MQLNYVNEILFYFISTLFDMSQSSIRPSKLVFYLSIFEKEQVFPF